MSERPLLAVAIPTCDDLKGLWATLVGLATTHKEVFDQLEIIVVDNMSSKKSFDKLSEWLPSHFPKATLVRFGPYRGTAVKNQCVMAATAKFVMVVDSHVTFPAGVLRKTLRFLERLGDSVRSLDLYQGPLVNPHGEISSTHMNPALSSANFGTWGRYRDDQRDVNQIYELPLHGTGMFIVRRDAWLGYHPAMRGFGSEEGYLHEKYRRYGRFAWGLPFLQWCHCFIDSENKPYPNRVEDRYRNLVIGWRELGLDYSKLSRYFQTRLGETKLGEIEAEVESLHLPAQPYREDYVPFLGYPIRVCDEPFRESRDYKEFEIPRYYTSDTINAKVI